MISRRKGARRRTKQLEVIWKVVRGAATHPTADQIYEKVRKSVPNISLGTVYRNLQKLTDQGKLRVVTVDRAQRFDPAVQPHDHFICEKCGQVYDIFSEGQKLLPASLPRQISAVTSHRLELYGRCRRCAE